MAPILPGVIDSHGRQITEDSSLVHVGGVKMELPLSKINKLIGELGLDVFNYAGPTKPVDDVMLAKIDKISSGLANSIRRQKEQEIPADPKAAATDLLAKMSQQERYALLQKMRDQFPGEFNAVANPAALREDMKVSRPVKVITRNKQPLNKSLAAI